MVYTDTFYTGDHKFPYAQAFIDRVSRFGDFIPLRSRTEVGAALITFVCRHFTPLVLISDNIAENRGGDLVEQCRLRDIKQLYTCPYHPQMIFVHSVVYVRRIFSFDKKDLDASGLHLLPKLFPMRAAHTSAGMSPNGEPLIPMRSPFGIREGSDPEYSFEGWTESDSLPEYEDHIQSGRLTRLRDRELVAEYDESPRVDVPPYYPSHPSFGEASAVAVHLPPQMGGLAPDLSDDVNETDLPSGKDVANEDTSVLVSSSQRSSGGTPSETSSFQTDQVDGIDAVPPTHPFGNDSLGTGGLDFMVYLDFPGQDRPRLRYRVYTQMPVRLLYRLIANGILGCEDEQIRLFVDNQCLLHLGTISDRFFPDLPKVSTVYLTRNCVVHVRMHDPNSTGGGTTPSMAERKSNAEIIPVMNQKLDQIDCTETLFGVDSASIDARSVPLRRVSTRIPVLSRSAKSLNVISLDSKTGLRRPVRDRWEYVPVITQFQSNKDLRVLRTPLCCWLLQFRAPE